MVLSSHRPQCYTFSSRWSVVAAVNLDLYIINHRALPSDFCYKYCTVWWLILHYVDFQYARDWSIAPSNYLSAKCDRSLCWSRQIVIFIFISLPETSVFNIHNISNNLIAITNYIFSMYTIYISAFYLIMIINIINDNFNIAFIYSSAQVLNVFFPWQ